MKKNIKEKLLQQKLGFICQLCGNNELEDFDLITWTSKNGGGGGRDTATCTKCKADYKAESKKEGWVINAPDKSTLIKQLSTHEIKEYDKKFEKYKGLGKSWLKFINKKRWFDKIWRYKEESDSKTSFALVRKGIPISKFRTTTNL